MTGISRKLRLQQNEQECYAGTRARRAPMREFADRGMSLYSDRGERKYLNEDERERVLAASEDLCRERMLFALTLAWSGARISEVLALSASSFQVYASIVSIRTLKRRRLHVREVPIPPE